MQVQIYFSLQEQVVVLIVFILMIFLYESLQATSSLDRVAGLKPYFVKPFFYNISISLQHTFLAAKGSKPLAETSFFFYLFMSHNDIWVAWFL